MDFRERYPVPLRELLIAPLIFRAAVPLLADTPQVTAQGMQDLAVFGGYAPGAIRTALSRLRASGLVETAEDEAGTTRYRLGSLSRSVTRTVVGAGARPEGLVLAVFAFHTDDARERRVVRDALRQHGFQRLAQNVYVHGAIDTSALEIALREQGVAGNVFLFRCQDTEDASLQARLAELFDLPARAAVLQGLRADLEVFLDPTRHQGDDLVRRLLYAGPVHHRLAWVEEPPLPARYHPPGYPLASLAAWLEGRLAHAGAALRSYHLRLNA